MVSFTERFCCIQKYMHIQVNILYTYQCAVYTVFPVAELHYFIGFLYVHALLKYTAIFDMVYIYICFCLTICTVIAWLYTLQIVQLTLLSMYIIKCEMHGLSLYL